MEEDTGSWKSHSFTLMIFGGIVILSSIFFVLGMLVGRSQGQRAAEVALADQASGKPGVEGGTDDFPLTFYNQSTEEKPDLNLQPNPAAPSQPVTPAPPPATASKNAPPPETSDAKTGKKSGSAPTSPPAKPASPPQKTAEAKPPTPKPPPAGDVYLQIASVQSEKQAAAELKKVQLKGFKAMIKPAKVKGETVYRVLVGPLKDSDVKSTTANLQGKGYKGTFPKSK